MEEITYIQNRIGKINSERNAYFQGIIDAVDTFNVASSKNQWKIEIKGNKEILCGSYYDFLKKKTIHFKFEFSFKIIKEKK